MSLLSQRALAAKVAKVGISRVRFNPENLKEIKEALTKADIKGLIKKGAIIILPKTTPSRVRAKARHAQRLRGRQRGPGSKKKAKISKKELWVMKVRALRKLASKLKDQNKITPKTYNDIRAKIKGNFFRDKAHLLLYLERSGLIKK
ncbi:MAG: 50S ribosomal protein L19e [Candidatus Nanoarchaeia archaeon]